MQDFKRAASEVGTTLLDQTKMGITMGASVAIEESLVDALHEVLPEGAEKALVTFEKRYFWVRDYVEPAVLGVVAMFSTKLWPEIPKADFIYRMGGLAWAAKWAEISKPAQKYVNRFFGAFFNRLKRCPGLPDDIKEAVA